jgi:hypothetical protein
MVLATWLIPHQLTDPNLRSQAPKVDPSNSYPGL